MKKYVFGLPLFMAAVVGFGLYLGQTWGTVLISAVALSVSLFTLMWHIHFYECDFGKLIINIAWRDDSPQKGLIINVINGGHKPITPIGLNCEKRDGHKFTFPNDNICDINGKILPPGGRIQTLVSPVVLIATDTMKYGIKKLWVKDMLGRDFFVEQSNLDEINKYFDTVNQGKNK